MSLRTFATGISALALVSAIVLGPVTLFSHIRATRDVMRAKVQAMSPDIQELARIRALLRDQVGRILEYREKLDDVSLKAESTASASARADQELNAQTEILSRAKTLIDQPRATYVIGGREYNRQQLLDDASARLKHCEQLRKDVASKHDIVATLRDAEAEGLAKLRQAEQHKNMLEAELKSLETRLANAGLLREVQELAGTLDDSPLGPQTELGEAFAQLRKRVLSAERHNDYIAGTTRNDFVVEWNPTTQSDAEIGDAISQFLTGTANP